MFRSKDFILMDVVDIKGKRIGFIKDIIIDFHKGEVNGFIVSTYKLFQKTISVLKKDIVSFNKSMIISRWDRNGYLQLSNIRNMDIINKEGDIIGMAEDILFQEFTFKIHGLIVSTGFIKNILSGKKILLMNSVILGEGSILNISNSTNVDFVSIPHKLFKEVQYNEKNI